MWEHLLADNSVIGFGDVTQDYFRGRRHYVGEGLGSVLGSLWALVRPVLRDIGKSTIDAVLENVNIKKRGRGVDIFDDGPPHKNRRTLTISKTNSKGHKKTTKKGKKSKKESEAEWPPKY